MTSAIAVLVLVAFLVWLSAARPSLRRLSGSDRERQLAELRAMSGYHSDPRLP